MTSSKANRIPLIGIQGVIFTLSVVGLILGAAAGCNVTLASRSNVINQASRGGANENLGEQDSRPTGGGTLTLPIPLDNEKGPQS